MAARGSTHQTSAAALLEQRRAQGLADRVTDPAAARAIAEALTRRDAA